MPWVELLFFLLALIGAGMPVEAPAAAEPVDFARDVQPIFEAKCQPCHFPGGKMHAKLPFDEPATIVKLDEKLFGRIRDEQSRAVIRRFLAEQKKRS
jgi:hypothetical protein